MDPDRFPDWGLSCFTFGKRLYDLMDDCRRACGADDVEVFIPAGVQEYTFSDDR
jgi:hypothetical protein